MGFITLHAVVRLQNLRMRDVCCYVVVHTFAGNDVRHIISPSLSMRA